MSRISDLKENWEKLRNRKLFLACSGGVDSMVLLHLLHGSGADLTVLHLNYQLRGEDSEQDESFVRQTCAAYGIPVEVKRIDMPKLLSGGGNLQDIARKCRYDWFRQILDESDNNRIALGHHQDDQVETFFQHIARKSGILGMAGMLEDHAGIVRPLLHCSKEEILDFARTNQVAWREDLSNQGNDYTRNKLRNLILPALEKEIPDLKASVLLLVDAFQRTQKELEKSVAPQLELIRETGNWQLFDFDLCSDEAQAEILRSLGIKQNFIAEIRKIRFSQKGKKLFIGDREIIRGADCLHFSSKQEETTFQLRIETVQQFPATFDKHVVYLDASKIQGTLDVRKWQVGDRMRPIGMQGSKLVSDILADAKLTPDKKKNALVLTDDENVLWCVGVKVSSLAVADEETLAIWKVFIE